MERDRDQLCQRVLIGRAFTCDGYGNSKLGRISGVVMSEKGGRQGSIEFGHSGAELIMIQTMENPSSAINPADGPPPHPKKVIVFNRPTNYPHSIPNLDTTTCQ